LTKGAEKKENTPSRFFLWQTVGGNAHNAAVSDQETHLFRV
jgi:hypothetical protein